MREFRDAAGATWTVFCATPHTAPGKREKVLPESYRHGWLVFECDIERRRLAPVPAEWEALSDRELAQLCMAADVVPVRRSGRPMASDFAPSAPDSQTSSPILPPADSASTPVRAAQVQELLADVIDEVCSQPRAQSLDTGELIKVEATLAIAAQAAREAVALRRAMHENQQ